jgi:hypothetical protein
MAKPSGWRTLATDVPQQKAYEYTRLLEKVTGEESVRKSLAKLLEHKAQEIKDFEKSESYQSKWIDTYRPDIEYKRGTAWTLTDAWMQIILDAWKKAQDRAFNAEEKLREREKAFDIYCDLVIKHMAKLGEDINNIWKEHYAKSFSNCAALEQENRELRRLLARYEEPRT